MRKFRLGSRRATPPAQAPPRRAEKPAGTTASLEASLGAWEDLDASAATAPALGTGSFGRGSRFFGCSWPAGTWRLQGSADVPPGEPGSRGGAPTGVGLWTGGWRRVAACSPACLRDVGDMVRRPKLASKQSYSQELSCLDNLEMSGLRFTCTCKHSC